MWNKLKLFKDHCVLAAREIAADEAGVGVVEIILILVVLISLVVIFKKQVTQIVKSILETAAKDAAGV